MSSNSAIDYRGAIDALLLDVDGTLFSSEGIIHKIYQDEFIAFQSENGRPAHIPSLPEIMEQIGKPVVEIFDNLAPDLTSAERSALSIRILKGLVKRIEDGAGLHYDGVRETVTKLKEGGLKIFTCSNGRRPYVEAILKANRIHDCFIEIGAVDGDSIKDKNELASSTIEKHNLDPERTILVGDRTSDRDAALASGCHFVSCSYGHGTADEHEGALFNIDTFSTLTDLI